MFTIVRRFALEFSVPVCAYRSVEFFIFTIRLSFDEFSFGFRLEFSKIFKNFLKVGQDFVPLKREFTHFTMVLMQITIDPIIKH